MRILFGILLTMVALTRVGWAQDEVAPTTTAESREVMKGVYERTFSLTPRVGALGYQDGDLNYTSRIIEGFTANLNLAGVMTTPENWNVGLESGLLYSHVGSPTSNFFGSNAGVDSTPGANSFLVPMNIALGYKPMDKFLIALNLGTNLVYRSIPGSMHFGRGSDTGDGNEIDFFPSTGLLAGWTLGRDVALSLRGDYIPTPADDMFTATLGATIGIA